MKKTLLLFVLLTIMCCANAVARIKPLDAFLDPISGTFSICAGNTNTLSNTTIGGTWESSTPSVATVNLTTGAVTAVSAGTTVITYTLGGSSVTAEVTVNALPAVITGTATVCVDATTTLSSLTTGGTWSSSNIGVATVMSGSGIVTGIAGGNTTISYSVDGCVRTIVVTTNPLPDAVTLTIPGSLCGGEIFEYETSPIVYDGIFFTYHPNVYIDHPSLGQMQVWNDGTTIINATVYHVRYNECGFHTDSANIEIKPMPTNIVGNTMMTVGEIDTLTSVSPGGIWSSSNPSRATINSITGILTTLSPGLTTINYTQIGGCYKSLPIAIDDGYPNAVAKINTIIGNGTAGYSPDGTAAGSAMVTTPNLIDIDGAGNIYYIDGRYIRKKSTDNIITTIAGNGLSRVVGNEFESEFGITPATGIPLRDGIEAMTVDKNGNVYVFGLGGIEKISTDGHLSLVAGYSHYYTFGSTAGVLIDEPAIDPGFIINYVNGMCTDNNGDLYYTDYYFGSVNKITIATNRVNTVAGNGIGFFHTPYEYYNTYNNVPATVAFLNEPRDVAVGKDGSIYIAETNGRKVLKVDTSGIIHTIAGETLMYSSDYGNGGPAKLSRVSVNKITVDSIGNLYISNDSVIRRISNEGIITAFAGTGSTVYNGECKNADAANIAAFDFAVDKDGGLIIAEGGNNRIRKIQNPDLYSPIITGRFTLNNPDTSQLAVSLPTGTWSSSNASVATVDTTGKVISISTGTATISYMLADTCLSPTATAVIYVNIDSDDTLTLSGVSSICPGSSTTVSASISDGLWISSNTSVATVDSTGLVTGLSTGTSIITYTVTDSTGTESTTLVITVLPSAPVTPTISGSDVVCADFFITLSASSTGGTWSSSNIAVANIGSTTGYVSALTEGTCTITYSLSNTCGTAIATKTITVNPTPSNIISSTGIFAVAVGSTVTLNCSPAGGTWSSSNANTTVNPATGVVTGIAVGTSRISYINAYGCYKNVLLNITTLADTTTGLKIYTIAGTGVAGYSGDGGLALNAKINFASYIVEDNEGNLYVNDFNNKRVRKISNTGVISTVAGNGIIGTSEDGVPATSASFAQISGIEIDSSGNLYIAEFSANKIRIVNPEGIVSTFAGTGASSSTGDGGHALSATFNRPMGLAFDNNWNLYVTEQEGHRVRKISSGSNIVSTITGTGIAGYSGDGSTATAAKISHPNYINVDINNNIYITDNGNHAFRKIDNFGNISTVAGNGSPGFSGNGGSATSAKLLYPAGSAIDNEGNIYISDYGNHRIRKINTSGIISTFAGTGTSNYNSDCIIPTSAWLNYPLDIIIRNDGSLIFSDFGNSRIRKIHTSNLISALISGNTNICVGDTASLTSSSTGGSWSSSNIAVATVNATGIVTGTGAGTAIISYYKGDSCSNTSGSIVVNIIESIVVDTITGSSELCTGSTITLSCSSSGGYWTSSNPEIATVNSIGIVTGINNGVVVITYSIANSCGTSIATKNISINSTPIAGTITGPLEVYTGTDISFTATTAGGVWSSSNTAVATISSTGMLSGLSAGTTTISYTLTNSCGTAIATKVVTVNFVLESEITGTLTACVGSTTTLSYAISGGSWSSSNPAIATINAEGVATGMIAGTTTISYTIFGVSSTTVLTVNPLPNAGAISGAAIVCAGSTITLTNPSASGGTWSSSSDAASVSSTGVVTGITAGSATISYSISNSCGTAVATKEITILSLPDAGTLSGTASICVGATTTFSSTVSGGTWSSGYVAGATVSSTGVVTGIVNGSFVISYRKVNGCGTAIATRTVTVSPVPNAGTIGGVNVMCVGTTTTMPYITAVGGVWSSSDPSVATISPLRVVTGIAAGTGTISHTVTNSCGTDVATKIITVNPIPVAGTLSGASAVCVGSTATIIPSASGGTWSSSNGARATVSSSGVVTGISGGAVVISYRVTNSCGIATATHAVTVSTVVAVAAISGSSSVCIGSIIAITNATAGGTWSSTNTSAATISSTGVVTGVAAGTTIISYVISNGCGTFAVTKALTVNPLMVAGTISGAAAMCAGSITTLSTTGTGGSWISGNPSAATINSVGVVTASATAVGTVPMTYRVTNSCGTSNAIHTITISPLPIVGTTSGASLVCAGSNSNYTNPLEGGVGVWSSSETTVATIVAGTGVLTGVAAGTTTISYVKTNGCGSSTATRVVTVLPLPVVGVTSGTSTICKSTTTTLTNTVPGGTWSSSYMPGATVTSAGVVTGLANGTFIISYRLVNGCGTSYALFPITIMSAPALSAITGTTTVCTTGTTTLSHPIAGGVWTSSNTGVTTIAAPAVGTVTGVAAGTSAISYTVTNMCGTSAVGRVVTVTACVPRPAMTGSTDDKNNLFSVVPNPTTGVINLTSNVAGKVSIYTIDGKQLQNYEAKAGITSITFPEGIASGVYMLRFEGNDGSSNMVRLVYQQ